jgi:hypothetical protein
MSGTGNLAGKTFEFWRVGYNNNMAHMGGNL